MSYQSQGGFTLVELLVSISIFAVITTVAVSNNNQFNGNVLLSNLAYEVALSIRQAQFYGVSVKQATGLAFDSGYGIHFDLSAPTTYALFEDKKPEDGSPDHVCGSTECGQDNVNALQIFSFQKGNALSKICLTPSGSNVTVECYVPSSGRVVDVTFLRPYPDAYIRSNGTAYTKAELCIKSPVGTVRKVTVESTGQISAGMDSSTNPSCS